MLRVCSTNALADEYNQRRLDSWHNKTKFVFYTSLRSVATPQVYISLKYGVPVQITRNIYCQKSPGRLLAANGTFAVFVGVDGIKTNPKKRQHIVQCRKADVHHLRLLVQTSSMTGDQSIPLPLMLDNGVYRFPVQLAFAVTIHRVQGQTLCAVCVNGAQLFDPQHLYMACSRVRSLSGLYCENMRPDTCISTKLTLDPNITTFLQANGLS